MCFIAVLALAACGSPAGERSEDAAAPGGGDTVEQEAADADLSQLDDAGSDVAGQRDAEPDRQVITTAHAAVEVDNTLDAVAELLDRTTGYGGYVEDRQQSTDDDGNPTYAALTLRIPAENLPELLEELAELGDVSQLSETARDVTGVVRDLDARIEALETSVDRLLEIMSEADSAEELLQVETTLSERQADLESLQAERNALGDQVEMSTLQVQLSTEPITEVQADGFLGGLQSGWNGLVSFVNLLLVATGAILPWLLVLAVPVVVVLLAFRRRKRRALVAVTATEPRETEQGNDAEPVAQPAAEPGADAHSKP